MFKKEIVDSLTTIDEAMLKIKIEIHNLDKLGFNTDELEKQLDNLGIEQYKLKNKLNGGK